MSFKNLPPAKRIQILVDSLDGSREINEALSTSKDGDSMIEILLEASSKLQLGLSRDDLTSHPPIRDWIWWKNKQALVTIGKGTPRHQQDRYEKSRWDSWSLKIIKLFKK